MRQVMECFQLIRDEGDGGHWLVVEQLHGGPARMSWLFQTREQAEYKLREARICHEAAYGCRQAAPIARPPRRRPVG